MSQNFRRQSSRFTLFALALICFGLTGCVERRYTIRTNPPGAVVIANGQEIGRTPVSASHTYYGDREFTLMLDGYQTEKIIQPIKAPWYDNYLTEFFTETLVPFTIRDEREFTYTLRPAENPQINDLKTVARASDLKQGSSRHPGVAVSWASLGSECLCRSDLIRLVL